MKSLENLLVRIRSAFPPNSLDKSKPFVAKWRDDCESRRWGEYLSNLHTWEDLTLERVRAEYKGDPSVTPFLLTAEACAQLIPAYMTICLKQGRRADQIYASLLSFLSSERDASGVLTVREFANALSVK